MSDEKTFKLDILASDRSFYSGPCEMLIFPALDGLQESCHIMRQP